MEEISEKYDTCGICGISAFKKCSACKQISYCSKEHQKSDWKRHKKSCKPFVVERDDKKGRCIVATRDINQDESLFREEPLVIGPRFVTSDSVCLGCFTPISPVSSIKCQKCYWPVCDAKCEGIQTIHRSECEILSVGRDNVKKKNNYKYELILPLKCLLLKKNNLSKWNIISEMEAHMDKRTPETETFREVQVLYKYLKDNFLVNLKENEKISQNDFHKICAIIEVNSLDVPFKGIELSALYETFSLLEHSCLPNIKISFKNFNVNVRSAGPIARNENICTMYTNIIWGTQSRQQHLQSTKYFVCECRRCKDPTELGTNFSSVRCLQDNCDSYLLPEDPLDFDTKWKCNKCDAALPAIDVNDIVSRLAYEVDQILENRNPNVKQVEELLDKLLSLLHPHHYNCFSIKHSLIQMYGQQNGYTYGTLENCILTRKLEYCRELLEILSKLDSTSSRAPLYVAVIKYELSAGILETMKRRLSETFDLVSIQDDGKEAKKLITQTIILLNEEPNSEINIQLIESCKNLYREIEDTLKGGYYTDL